MFRTYKVTAKNLILEKLAIKRNGKTLRLTVRASLDDFARTFPALMEDLKQAEEKLAAGFSQETMDAFCAATRACLAVLFGEDATGKLFDFYEGHTLDLMDDITPFIYDRIVPAISKYRLGKVRREVSKSK